jgi:EPS-associated MarR family transcriptional regulator
LNSIQASDNMTSTLNANFGENHLRLLRLIEANPDLSQRDLSRELGMSLGKVNYCLKALVDKGLVKAGNFNKNNNKLSYAYLLTPRGIKSKTLITADFLQRKIAEYESLKTEIAELKREVSQANDVKGAQQ